MELRLPAFIVRKKFTPRFFHITALVVIPDVVGLVLANYLDVHGVGGYAEIDRDEIIIEWTPDSEYTREETTMTHKKCDESNDRTNSL